MRPDDPERLDPDLDPEDDPGEDLEASIELADHAFGAESFGTTAEEQLRGESLDQRLSEERPDGRAKDVEISIEDARRSRRRAADGGRGGRRLRSARGSRGSGALPSATGAPGAVDHEDDYVEEMSPGYIRGYMYPSPSTCFAFVDVAKNRWRGISTRCEQ